MRTAATAAVIAGLLVGCRQAGPTTSRKAVVPIAQPVFIEESKLGTGVGANGMATGESATFAPGDPIYFSMRFEQSPRGLAATARWFEGAGDKEVAYQRHEMKGAKSVTFDMRDTRKWKPGHYRVEGYWGGNLADTKEFDIVPKKK
jgi:hypothetical protein